VKTKKSKRKLGKICSRRRRRRRETCGRACSKTVSEEAASRIVGLSLSDARRPPVIVWRPVCTYSPGLSQRRRPDAGGGAEQTRPVKCSVNINWWDRAAGMPAYTVGLYACLPACVSVWILQRWSYNRITNLVTTAAWHTMLIAQCPEPIQPFKGRSYSANTAWLSDIDTN